MGTQLVTTATVPGTPVTITITRTVDKRGTVYVTTRETNGATYVNYLSCGRKTESEARAEANKLWTDTVSRRDVHASRKSVVVCDWCHKPGKPGNPLLFGRKETMAHNGCDNP